ncbi:aminoglycoside phosphotransferase family protein [Nonomuraea rosea]|uniref:Aminoglycoside phosphotransferase family protein n=1 Tax=Nonomuraea rosea TaxID=638574 RepID=A0ABP6ZL58_9ACTN
MQQVSAPVISAPPDGRAGITADLVRRLIAAQFPQWDDLPIAPVPEDGHDNRTYRLGESMTVRLPTAEGYVPAVEKESLWLPRLAPHLPVAVPPILATGESGEGYPHPWSVRGWLEGETAHPSRIGEMPSFAVQVAEFILALRRCDATGGPPAGAHSFYRGASLTHYDEETRRCLAALEGHLDTGPAAEVWQAALDAGWAGDPVWFHGGIAEGNLLVADGRLSAVIDFGTSGIGDPACDLVIAWGMFTGEAREAFRAAAGGDRGMWARARGWLLWKSLLVLTWTIDSASGSDQRTAAHCRRVVTDILSDHRQSA